MSSAAQIPGDQIDDFALLVEASSRLLRAHNLPEVLGSILDLASRAIPTDAYGLWRRKGSAWSPIVSKGLSPEYLQHSAPEPAQTIPEDPIILHKLGMHPLLAGRLALYEREGIRALAAIPLTIHGERSGTIVFYSRTPHVFSESEIRLASAIANLAGSAITTAELYEDQRTLMRDKERAQQRTMFLAEASQVLASSLNYEETLRAVALLAVGYLSDWCWVDIADSAGGAPRRLAGAHIDPEKIAWAEQLRKRYPPGPGDAAARVIRSGEPLLYSVIEDAMIVAAAVDEEHLRLIRQLGPVSFICVPMIARGRVFGALSLLTTESGRRYTEEDLQFAQELANRCALAIDNARLYTTAMENADRERGSRMEFETLAKLAQVLSGEIELRKLVQAVTDAATEATGAEFGSFFYNVTSAEGESYLLYTLSGVDASRFEGFPMPRATGLFGPTFRGEGVVRIEDVKTDPRYGMFAPYHGMPPGHLPVVSYLAIPVKARSGEVIGGLFFGHQERGMFTERHERVLIGLAAQAGVAMENAMLLDSVQKARREAALAHEQLSDVLDSTTDAVAVFDSEWRVIRANHRSAALLQIGLEEMAGLGIGELLGPGLGGERLDEMKRAIAAGQALRLEQRVEAENVWLELHAFPTSFGAAVFVRDVSDKHRLEDQLRQTAKLESLGVLAGGVAHDFNNLLVGILGNASLALEGISPSSPVRDILQDVITASERAANLTRQLLAYAGKGRFVIQPLDVSDLIREIAALLQTSIPRFVQLRVNLADNLPCVEADAAQIQQLLMNLIINGAEAIGDGNSGTVSVTTGLQDVDGLYIENVLAPSELKPGRYVSIEVSDSGCGMDEQTVSKIFDPFFTTKFTGRGLGLAAALGIVRGHRGALKVYSTPGRGSTFKVLFPATAAAVSRPSERSIEASKGTGLVLVVDDEEIVRRTARNALERYGYSVITAEDGSEGARLVETLGDRINLVLLDLTMPVMGGEEALRTIRTLEPGMRVVLSSGFNEDEAVQRFAGKGLAGFLQKPFSAADLADVVRAALEAHA